MDIAFTKMHGIGNDFVLIDCRDFDAMDIAKKAKKLCDRRYGIGADQLLLLLDSSIADYRMLIFNADGGEVEMCGNGIRCFAKYLVAKKITSKTELAIETLAGIIQPKVREDMIEVNMGSPILEGKEIPVRLDGRILSKPLKIEDRSFDVTCLSMGNPHCVIFVDDVEKFPLTTYGPLIEKNELFPKRINVEFVEIINDREIKIRVWERGSGETLACGTGACASAVASILNEKTHKRVTVHLAGGDLDILWGEDDDLYMTGAAEEVFEGVINL